MGCKRRIKTFTCFGLTQDEEDKILYKNAKLFKVK